MKLCFSWAVVLLSRRTSAPFFLDQTEALAFNRLNAQQLGQRLLRWQGQNSQWVDSYKVKKTKKNKGQKRKQWWKDVKDWHAQQTGNGNQNDGKDSTAPAAPTFPTAPWNQPPVDSTIKVPDDDEEEEEPVAPGAMDPLFKGDKKDDPFGGDDDGSLGPLLMPKIFGP